MHGPGLAQCQEGPREKGTSYNQNARVSRCQEVNGDEMGRENSRITPRFLFQMTGCIMVRSQEGNFMGEKNNMSRLVSQNYSLEDIKEVIELTRSTNIFIAIICRK